MNTQPGGPQNNPPRNIHTVTEVLLGRFTDSATGKLKAYYLPRRREYDNPPSMVGRVFEYIKHDVLTHEKFWSDEVETFLPAAFAAVDDETIFNQPDLVKVLKECIALHWARSATYKEAHERLFKDVTERQKQEWFAKFKPTLASAFYDRYGLYPAGDQALAHINDLVHEAPEIVVSGEWFAKRVREMFDFSRNHFANNKLEIGRPPVGHQLIIGDSPALTLKSDGHSTSFGAPLLEAGTVLLPIGPTYVIGLGKADSWVDLDAGRVDLLNAMQARAALTWVMYHPSASMSTFIDQVRPQET